MKALTLCSLFFTSILVAKTPVSLPNCGNSCFFNSVIQSLYALPLLQQSLTDQGFDNQLKQLFSALDNANPKITTYENISDTTKKAVQTFLTTQIEQDKQGLPGSAVGLLRKFFETLTNKNLFTITKDIFEQKGTTLQPKKEVRTPILKTIGTKNTLTEGLSKSLITNLATADGKRIEYLKNLPHYITIEISWDVGKLPPFTMKIPKNVDFGQFSQSRKSNIYDLKAAIMHKGSTLSSGHAFAYVQHNSLWYLCDDWSIEQKNPFFLSNNAPWPQDERPIVLIYEKTLSFDDTLISLSQSLAIFSTNIKERA